MLYDVIAYKNTGFNSVDIPSSPSLLEGCEKTLYPQVDVVQNRGLAILRLADEYDNIKSVDYIKVGDAYYTLASYPVMLSDSVVEFTLREDFITTLGGIETISFKNAYIEYAHVPDDTFARWVIPDTRWTPSKIIELEQESLLVPPADPGVINIKFISSTIDLVKQGRTKECVSYTDTTQPDLSVQVPEIFQSEVNTRFAFKALNADGDFGVRYTTTPSTYIYQMGYTYLSSSNDEVSFDNPEVMMGISRARGLGIDSCILAQYLVPSAYIDIPSSKINGENLQYTKIVPTINQISNKSLNFMQDIGSYTPHNNKVFYSNEWNKITIFNMASGASSSFMPENLYKAGTQSANTPQFIITADLRATGKPICYPLYLYGKINRYMQNAVFGLTWQNAEVVMYGAAGQERAFRDYAYSVSDRNFNRSYANKQAGVSALKGYGDNIMGLAEAGANGYKQMQGGAIDQSSAGLVSGAGSRVSGLLYSNTQYQLEQQKRDWDYNFQRYKEAERYVYDHVVVSPNVYFPRGESLRDFFGNGFFALRYHLSETDAREYDEFLDLFGYPVGEVSDSLEFFKSRAYFNYVSCSSITILEDGYTMQEREGLSEQLKSCRLWHVLPKSWNKSMGNPIL